MCELVLSRLIKSLLITVGVIIAMYSFYCVDKLGFGKVEVPDWYELNESHLEPFPLEEVTDYWLAEGFTFALKMGLGALILSFGVGLAKDIKTRKEVTSNAGNEIK